MLTMDKRCIKIQQRAEQNVMKGKWIISRREKLGNKTFLVS